MKEKTNRKYKETFFKSRSEERPYKAWLVTTYTVGKLKSIRLEVIEFMSHRGWKFIYDEMRYWIRKNKAKLEKEAQ